MDLVGSKADAVRRGLKWAMLSVISGEKLVAAAAPRWIRVNAVAPPEQSRAAIGVALAAAVPARSLLPTYSLSHDRRMARVLVVDDDEDVRLSICRVLEEDGIETLAAENGQQALALLEAANEPCLIVLDLMMPGMNGWVFRERQLADPRIARWPVIVLTATSQLRESAIEATDLVRKPVSLEKLLETVRRYLPFLDADSAASVVRDELDISDSPSSRR